MVAETGTGTACGDVMDGDATDWWFRVPAPGDLEVG